MRSLSHPFRVRVIRPLEPVRSCPGPGSPRGRRLLAAIAALWFALAACAIPPAAAAEGTVTLNFVNADIEAVIRAVAEMTGRNFVVDPKVKGTINIISAKPVPVGLVYPTLLSALRLQGFAAIEDGAIVKIVPEADAKQQGGTVLSGGVGPGGDRLVTEVVPLRFESAAQLVNVLRPLITPNNTITAYPATNALVITDYASNLKRIERIIATLDQPPSGEPTVVPVRHASALDLVAMLNKLVIEGAPADQQQRVTMVADPRSNSIIIRSDNSGRAARVRQLIEQLDTPGRAGGNIYIIYLKHAEATRIATTLRALLSGGGESGVPGAGMTQPAATPGQTGGGALAQTVATVASVATGVGFSAGGVAIQADPTNNALIIQAPEPVYNNLRSIIDRLDIRRAQVYIEALVVEVSANRAAEFGIQWQALSGIGRSGVQGFGGTNFGVRGSGNNIIDAAINPGTLGQGLNIGILNGVVTIPGLGEILNLAFLARALETDADANILATPALLTLDNEEARIIVGQNVPFITGQYAQTGSSTSVTPFQTVERRDVGLTLRVKPQITEGGGVRLVVYQEVSRVDSQTNPAGIITNKRALESLVTVDDGQIVVLGGLISEEYVGSTDKVPLAGDIPFIGGLFRYDNRQRVKTNLMVFIRPTVVRGGRGAETLTQERYDYLLGEQQRVTPEARVFWNDTTRPQMQLPAGPSTAPLIAPLPRPVPVVPRQPGGPDAPPATGSETPAPLAPAPSAAPGSPASPAAAPASPAG